MRARPFFHETTLLNKVSDGTNTFEQVVLINYLGQLFMDGINFAKSPLIIDYYQKSLFSVDETLLICPQ